MRVTHLLTPALALSVLAACENPSLVQPDGEPSFAPCTDSGPCFDPPETLWYYGSDTQMVNGTSVFNPDVHKGNSWTHSDWEGHSGIRVDATAYWYLNCGGSAQFYQSKSASATSGHVEVSFRREIEAVTNDGFQVRGTHTFTRTTGTPLVYPSEASHCDDGW